MEFEWDEAKNRANRAKHGFSFEFAAEIFDGRVRESVDPRHWGEQRIVATGQVRGRYVTVVYTLREGRCRIISARSARAREKFL